MENVEYKGYTIKINYDELPWNPREDDNIGIMLCFHNRYTLGDKHDLKADDFAGWDEMEKHIKKELKGIMIKPLFLYDHSGLSLRTYPHGQHSGWDGGYVGFIYTTKAQLKKIGVEKHSRKKIEKYLESEIETYSNYLNGNVYCFSVEDENGNKIEDDGCSNGWYDTDDLIKEAQRIIDFEIKNRESELPKGALINTLDFLRHVAPR